MSDTHEDEVELNEKVAAWGKVLERALPTAIKGPPRKPEPEPAGTSPASSR